MPFADTPIRVDDLRELVRGLEKVDVELKRGLQTELAAAAEPVRGAAQTLATEKIRNIGEVWPRMRIGVTARSVYVAPATRRSSGHTGPRWHRPNLAVLLLQRAMGPALEQKTAQVVERVEIWINRLLKTV